MPESDSRADRILDAAGELLIRMGHRKVTMEDIAGRAGVGKGTVYLHWRTKTALFHALFLRESIRLLEQLRDAIREDPGSAAPHRFTEESFVLIHRRPILRALFTGDTELIGILKDGPTSSQDILAGEQFYALMFRHGLLRADVPNIAYALQATGTGFFLYGQVNPETEDVPDERAQAEALGHTVRAAFEPDVAVTASRLAEASTEICSMFDDMITNYRKWIYEKGPDNPG